MIRTIEISNKVSGLLLAAFIAVFTAACSDEKAPEETANNQQSANFSDLSNSDTALGKFKSDQSFSEDKVATREVQSNGELSGQDNQSVEQLEYLEDQSETSYYESSTKVTFNAEETEGVIRWEAPEGINYSNAQVTISAGGGDRTTRNFSPGEPIELYGDLPDGVYDWETVISPEVDEYTRQEMREVRQSGDFQAEKELIARLRSEGSIPTDEQARKNRQSGSFIVENGVVRPSLVDAPKSDQDGG